MTFSDAEETMNDSELPDYKEDGIDVEMHLADRYVVLYFIFKHHDCTHLACKLLMS